MGGVHCTKSCHTASRASHGKTKFKNSLISIISTHSPVYLAGKIIAAFGKAMDDNWVVVGNLMLLSPRTHPNKLRRDDQPPRFTAETRKDHSSKESQDLPCFMHAAVSRTKRRRLSRLFPVVRFHSIVAQHFGNRSDQTSQRSLVWVPPARRSCNTMIRRQILVVTQPHV